MDRDKKATCMELGIYDSVGDLGTDEENREHTAYRTYRTRTYRKRNTVGIGRESSKLAETIRDTEPPE